MRPSLQDLLIIGLSPGLGIFILGNLFPGTYDWLELRLYDLRAAWSPLPEGAKEPILIVDVDEKSLAELGPYHRWPRLYHARVIQALTQAQAVGFYLPIYEMDLLSTEEIEFYKRELGPRIRRDLDIPPARAERVIELVMKGISFDVDLIQAVSEHERVFWNFEFSDQPSKARLPGSIPAHGAYGGKIIPKDLLAYPGFKAPDSLLLRALGGHLGFGELFPDPDNRLRSQPLLIRSPPGGGDLYPSFALSLALNYWKVLYPHLPAANRMELGPHSLPLERGARLRYLPVRGDFPRVSYSDLLKGRVPEEKLKEKIVLVGSSRLGFGTIQPDWVRGQAVILANLLQGTGVHNLGPILPLLLTALLGLGIAFLGFYYPIRIALPGWSVVSGLYSLLAFELFRSHGAWLELARPLIAFGLVFGLSVGYRCLIASRDVRGAGKALLQNMPKDRVARLIKTHRLPLPSRTQGLTLIWAELKDFTPFTRIPAREAEAALQELKAELESLILSSGGVILSIIPHGMVGLFGYPEPMEGQELVAARVGLQMRSSFSLIGPRWLAEGKGRLELGISLTTGTGTAGMVRLRPGWSLQVMGKVADEISLVAAWTRTSPAQVVITESIYNRLKTQCRVRRLGILETPGGRQDLYELLRLEV